MRENVVTIWDELWQRSSFAAIEEVWVDPAIEYPQIKHNQAVLATVVALAKQYEASHGLRCSISVLVAGAVLSDVSKLVEFESVDGRCQRTELGRLLPHAAYAAHVALERNVPLEVVHIILSHSPFSGLRPVTTEAQLVYWADQADLTAIGQNIWSRQVSHVPASSTATSTTGRLPVVSEPEEV